jgi:TetR/AcrR family transcriptional regulator
MTTPTSTHASSDRSAESRTRILDAAIRQFSLNGLAGARTEQIAEEAGVNKALLYYYFKGKEDLYASALESVAEGVRASSVAALEGSATPGERFLCAVLNHFDRIHTNSGFQNLMQQEMIRLHRGEENALTTLAEKVFRPLHERMMQVIGEGVASGELIAVDPLQFTYAALGANVFYFLSAPMMRLVQGKDIDPLDPGVLEFRRSAAITYLGKAIFVDRAHGTRVAARVLALTPMPPSGGVRPHWLRNSASESIEK